MKTLKGLREYIDNSYELSVFDTARESDQLWSFHLHGRRLLTAKIQKIFTYDVKLVDATGTEEIVPKVHVKFLYPKEYGESIDKLLKVNKKVATLRMDPLFSPHLRHFVKNKSLFPLMMEKQVLFFTTLEGDVIRGLVAGFSRFDIQISLKGPIPITILRHSIYDIRDKKDHCYLKSYQETHRDWQRSELFQDG
ncbi:MAG: hypothetical protein JRH15_10920 [Deltaproteobacteria bacterium]|nr:hypothetical protein [Deltaproteobacteria bacterium]